MLFTVAAIACPACVAFQADVDAEAALGPVTATVADAAELLKPFTEDEPRFVAIDPRKVIYTASLQIAAPDVDAAVTRTARLAESAGGYVQQMTNDAIVIRVPADAFGHTLTALADIGTIVTREITARDVTEEYTDLQIRLTSAKALLVRLQNLLEKASDVKQALEIEREMARVQAEIEKLQGSLNSLSSRINYATFTIRFLPVRRIPQTMRLQLPFWWLSRLGLENLMTF